MPVSEGAASVPTVASADFCTNSLRFIDVFFKMALKVIKKVNLAGVTSFNGKKTYPVAG